MSRRAGYISFHLKKEGEGDKERSPTSLYLGETHP